MTAARPADGDRRRSLAWRLMRALAELLRRLGLLRPVFWVYESILALRPRNLGTPRRAPDGLPVPPARLRVRVGPRSADVGWFLESGADNARMIARVVAASGGRIEDFEAILDFGCGCGRVLRHWRHLDGVEVHGTDKNERLLRWCRRNLPFGSFARNELAPPTAYPAGKFDLVYAISVLTHMPEDLQHAWMAEFARMLRPGGYLLVSTHGDAYAERLTPRERAAYASGELVVLYEEAAGTGLCSAYHPVAYVQEVLAAGYAVEAFEPAAASGQDVHLLSLRAA